MRKPLLFALGGALCVLLLWAARPNVVVTVRYVSSAPPPALPGVAFTARYVRNGTARSPVIRDAPEGWAERRRIAAAQAARQVRTVETPGRFFFQSNWEPSVACAYERRLGSPGEGGKWVCDPHRLTGKVVVYSVGSKNEFSFEQAVRDVFGARAEIHTFDPGEPAGVPAYVTYHRYAVGADHPLTAILEELGHARVDVLKIDVEGSEYEVMHAAKVGGALARVDQIQVEVHLLPDVYGDTGPMDPSRVHALMIDLNAADFEIFHKESNTLASGDACEFSLVRVTWS